MVVHAPRFMDAAGLLRTWVETAAPSGAVVAKVIAPSPLTTEDEYWGALAASLPRPDGPGHGHDDNDDPSPFATVLRRLRALRTPTVLVLDDLHLVDESAARLDELVDHAPTAGVRVLASYLWSRLPGPKPVRILLAVVLVLATILLLMEVVFPWVAAQLPYTDVTV